MHYVGTTHYMAPEQFLSIADIDGRADIFSLGVVIYEVLAGTLPHGGDQRDPASLGRVILNPKPLSDIRDDVPEELSDLVSKALVFEPEARLRSAGELRDGLQAAIVHPVRPRFRRRLGALALVVAVVVAVVLIFWRGRASPVVDDDRVAIAPFEVMQSQNALWREGFVDVLSANLDGAGPLRTVPPSVVNHLMMTR